MSIEVVGSKAGLVDSRGAPVPRDLYGDIKIPNIKIVGPRLLVMPVQAKEETSKGGVIIPEAAQKTTQRAVVVGVGQGTILTDGTHLPCPAEIGDEIIYARYAGTELELEDVTYLIIQDADVRCIMTYRGKVFTLVPDTV